jgi:hypothetical protein
MAGLQIELNFPREQRVVSSTTARALARSQMTGQSANNARALTGAD